MIRVVENCTGCGSLRVIPTSLPAMVVLSGGPGAGIKVELPADGGITPVQHSAEGLEPGTYQLSVWAEGRQGTVAEVDVQAGQMAEVRVDALPALPPPPAPLTREQCQPPLVWDTARGGLCRKPEPGDAPRGPSWHWYAFGGLAALGLIGAGLMYAGGEDESDEPSENPRRRRRGRR